MAEGKSTKSYDKMYEKAVFELLKKNWDYKNNRLNNIDIVNMETDRLWAEAALRAEAAEDKKEVPPPKKPKYEKAEETHESSKAEETMGNVQEESVDYNKFYSKFIQRALNTIGDKFDLIQNRVDNYGMVSQIEMIRSITGYIDVLQKIFTLMQQIEEKDKRIKKKWLNKLGTRSVYPSSL